MEENAILLPVAVIPQDLLVALLPLPQEQATPLPVLVPLLLLAPGLLGPLFVLKLVLLSDGRYLPSDWMVSLSPQVLSKLGLRWNGQPHQP